MAEEDEVKVGLGGWALDMPSEIENGLEAEEADEVAGRSANGMVRIGLCREIDGRVRRELSQFALNPWR